MSARPRSRRSSTPEDLRDLINEYHRAVADTVARLDGFVAKYMGDGVLIYFGYPLHTGTTSSIRLGQTFFLPFGLANMAEGLVRQGNPAEAVAAMSLARLWLEQGRQGEAHDILAPVYGWFTEGFDIAELRDAKTLLDELT